MSRWPVRISQTGGGPPPPPSSQDRFAPKYMVGGPDDSAPALLGTGGFWYFPDTGNGFGIQSALAQALADGGGDVYIRPGTFIVNPAFLPFQIPKGVRVIGAGIANGTRIKHDPGVGESLTVFQMADGSELRDIAIDVADAVEEGPGTGLGVVEVGWDENDEGLTQCERVLVLLDRSEASISNLRSAFYVNPRMGLTQDRCVVGLKGSGGASEPPSIDDALAGWRTLGKLRLDACEHKGGDAGVIGKFIPGQFENEIPTVDIDQCEFVNFRVVGIYTTSLPLAVTGGTLVTSGQKTEPVCGIRCTDTGQGILIASAMIHARVFLSENLQNPTVGIELDVAFGQVTGCHVQASQGIVSFNPQGGVAIGFNTIRAAPNSAISAQLVDEVAHNISLPSSQ